VKNSKERKQLGRLLRKRNKIILPERERKAKEKKQRHKYVVV